MTKVDHIKNRDTYHPFYCVYIGRGSMFGNPYIIGKHGTRKQVIDKYRTYFYNKIKFNTFFKKSVLSLKDKVLLCFCAPKPCHGDVIAEYLDGGGLLYEEGDRK